MKIILGGDLPGRCLQLQSSPSRELRSPGHHRELRAKKYTTEAPPYKRSDDRQPGYKRVYHQEYWAEEKAQHITQKLTVRENYPTTLEPPSKNAGQRHQKFKG